MAEIKELIDRVGKISEDFKQVREKIDKDIKTHGEMLAETKEQFEKSFNDLAETAKKANEKAAELEKRLEGVKKPVKIAVLGCVVNGPGEASDADIGIAAGKGVGILYGKGVMIRKIKRE